VVRAMSVVDFGRLIDAIDRYDAEMRRAAKG
jgi:hypothetical protein